MAVAQAPDQPPPLLLDYLEKRSFLFSCPDLAAVFLLSRLDAAEVNGLDKPLLPPHGEYFLPGELGRPQGPDGLLWRNGQQMQAHLPPFIFFTIIPLDPGNQGIHNPFSHDQDDIPGLSGLLEDKDVF